MDQPAEKNKPKDRREEKLNHGDEQPPLQQLAESGHKQTAEGRNHVTG